LILKPLKIFEEESDDSRLFDSSPLIEEVDCVDEGIVESLL